MQKNRERIICTILISALFHLFSIFLHFFYSFHNIPYALHLYEEITKEAKNKNFQRFKLRNGKGSKIKHGVFIYAT